MSDGKHESLPHEYLLSLPERALRSMSALSAGLLRELSEVVLPRAVRRTRLYTELVENTLRFLIENVGQVEGTYPPRGHLADNFALPMDASHGKYPGWSVPQRDIQRMQVWNSDGDPVSQQAAEEVI